MAGIKRALVDTGYYLGGLGTLYALSSVAPSGVLALQAAPLAFSEYASVCGLLSSATLVVRRAYR